jgi:hypothetical protein
VLQCGHSVQVACHAKAPLVCRQKIDTVYTYACGVHSTSAGICSKYTELEKTKPQCEKKVACRRFRCGHEAVVACCAKELAEKMSSQGHRLSYSTEIGESGTYYAGFYLYLMDLQA